MGEGKHPIPPGREDRRGVEPNLERNLGLFRGKMGVYPQFFGVGLSSGVVRIG